MESVEEVLKPKSIIANNSKYFVFLPNDIINNKTQSGSINKNPVLCDALTSKNAGNESFEKEKYKDAIGYYNQAIKLLETLDDKSCTSELSKIYNFRGIAQRQIKNYASSLYDASKAIELDAYNHNTYVCRAMTYYDLKKYYCALQDIMQACVLQRFKNQTCIKMVGEIMTVIDLDLVRRQWKNAYKEMVHPSFWQTLLCSHCSKQQIKFVKELGILDTISVPIPNKKSLTGYFRAMKGLQQSKISDIIAGCNEERIVKGKYLAQSFILKAYINSASSFSNEWSDDMQRMNEIISDATSTENIKLLAKLCRANLYNTRKQFDDAKQDLRSLEEQYSGNVVFGLIRNGLLFQLASNNTCFHVASNKCRNECCINDIKQSLKLNEDELVSWKVFLDYFGSTTNEYAKAIEISTIALFTHLQKADFQEIFEHRQSLLRRIIHQKFWDKL